MKPGRITLVVLATVGALAVFAGAFVYSGAYNVAAPTGHMKPVAQLLRTLMMRSVAAHARHISPPPSFDPKNRTIAEEAAGHYELMCRTCHGAPGKKPDPWQLYPPAPDLADALRVMKWSDPEVFWIIKNGIKDTGMSAFGGSHSDEDLWALTALIRRLEAIMPDEYRSMSERAAAQGKDGNRRDQDHPPAQPQQAPPHKH